MTAPNNKGKKYLTKFTPKQQKFIDLYTSKYGELSATECAIRAGYDRDSAHTRAHELLDWRKHPEVVKKIDERMIENKELWLVDKEKHLANLNGIGKEARAKGLYGVAAKCEELKGKAQGFYIDRNMTLTKELTEEELNEKILKNFKSVDEYDAFTKDLKDALYSGQKVTDIRQKKRDAAAEDEREMLDQKFSGVTKRRDN